MNKQELITKKEGLQKDLEKAKRQAQLPNLSENQTAFVAQKIDRIQTEISELEQQILVAKDEPVEPQPVPTSDPVPPVSSSITKSSNKRGRPVGTKKKAKKEKKLENNKNIESVIEEPESDVEALKESALQRSGFR